jgi:hypothetical protein
MASREERKIQDVTVEMAINGARAVKSMVTETWLLYVVKFGCYMAI